MHYRKKTLHTIIPTADTERGNISSERRTIPERIFRHMSLGILIILLLTAGSLTGCLRDTETETQSTEETETAEETRDPSWRFKDAFSARQACTNALDLIHHIGHYDEAAMEEYRGYQIAIREILTGEDTTQAQLEALYPQIVEKAGTLSLKRGDVARVYITTNNGTDHIGRDYKVCRMGFVPAEGEEGEEMSFLNCEIRVRGNSTGGGPKFPYSIKLPYNESLFGMDAGKRWNLLANLHDKSLMRGYIGFTLAGELGAPYTPQTKLVEVYLNNSYLGNYELVEAISDASGRVDVDTDDHECILEIDVNRDDGSHYLTTSLGLRFKVDRPEKVSGEMADWLEKFLLEAETAVAEGRAAEYFDFASFVNVYLTLEYTKNLDSNSFSTRYFIKDNKIYAGPVWDFDLSSGNVSDRVDEEGYRVYLNIQGRGDNSYDSTRGLWNREGWFKALFEYEEFSEMVTARYNEMRPLFENVYADNELGQSLIGRLQEQYGASFRRNYEETDWDIMERYSPYHMEPGLDYDGHVQFLTDWFRNRLAWLDTVYKR